MDLNTPNNPFDIHQRSFFENPDQIQTAMDEIQELSVQEDSALTDKTEPQPTKEAGVSDRSESGMDEMSDADEPMDTAELLKDSAYIGEVPIQTIMESITKQFEDYIKLEDSTDYVDIFYDQWDESMKALQQEEEFLDEKRDILNEILDQFTDFMARLFEQRLMITISIIDAEEYDPDQVEYIIRKLYEFFILNAKKNFKTVVSTDINSKLKNIIEDDKQYFDTIHRLLLNYSPLVTTITPTEFLSMCGATEIQEFYNDGEVMGNFLRKYSMKLYQNELFEVELINHITLVGTMVDEVLSPVDHSE